MDLLAGYFDEVIAGRQRGYVDYFGTAGDPAGLHKPASGICDDELVARLPGLAQVDRDLALRRVGKQPDGATIVI